MHVDYFGFDIVYYTQLKLLHRRPKRMICQRYYFPFSETLYGKFTLVLKIPKYSHKCGNKRELTYLDFGLFFPFPCKLGVVQSINQSINQSIFI